MTRTLIWSYSAEKTGPMVDHKKFVLPQTASLIYGTDTATIPDPIISSAVVQCKYSTTGNTATLRIGNLSKFPTKPYYCILTRGGPTTMTKYTLWVPDGSRSPPLSLKSLSYVVIDEHNNIAVYG